MIKHDDFYGGVLIMPEISVDGSFDRVKANHKSQSNVKARSIFYGAEKLTVDYSW